ncbi:MAG TPA: nitrous oxide-stimulated promoter family protein [Bacteroidales bacterium]|nr:nitrous oxide-stimulated promoter family protein [Bacteroidales bacterium]
MKISRIEREKKTVEFMIRLYCKKKEGNKSLCLDCEELIDYSKKRLDNCLYGAHKHACKHCPVHCFKPTMQSKMRQVMRFSGSRMIFYYPKETLVHLFNK